MLARARRSDLCSLVLIAAGVFGCGRDGQRTLPAQSAGAPAAAPMGSLEGASPADGSSGTTATTPSCAGIAPSSICGSATRPCTLQADDTLSATAINTVDIAASKDVVVVGMQALGSDSAS